MRIAVLFLVVLSLAACAETANQTEGTFVYNGRALPTVTREFVRNDGTTFERRSIQLGGRSVTCSATDDQDCVAAIRDRNHSGNR
ncbi:hypothetical protein [Tateyamaria pelophila]|uniref:hypothetical protein n=1 Tax=Tateyamaria pelophila TaxID=328415 RepID=UPI001CBD0B80|nr:hypothetical protein [Tateyamaria pelophila]